MVRRLGWGGGGSLRVGIGVGGGDEEDTEEDAAESAHRAQDAPLSFCRQ